jgi:hypothetical protein
MFWLLCFGTHTIRYFIRPCHGLMVSLAPGDGGRGPRSPRRAASDGAPADGPRAGPGPMETVGRSRWGGRAGGQERGLLRCDTAATAVTDNGDFGGRRDRHDRRD